MKLMGFLPEEAILLDMQARSKDEAIRELLQVAVEKGGVAAKDAEALYKQALEREKRGTTGLGEGIAIPHVKDSPQVTGLTGAFGRCKRGIKYDAVDGNPVSLMFLILGGPGTSGDHQKILRTLASLRQNEHFLRFLREARDQEAVADVLKEMAAGLGA
jgi:PTS system fructose-specific IIC component